MRTLRTAAGFVFGLAWRAAPGKLLAGVGLLLAGYLATPSPATCCATSPTPRWPARRPPPRRSRSAWPGCWSAS
ncbi:hypothetical protein ACFQY4_28435 [Catellatospora bangladeshensis]|uniref:hypothetical protein n=1 Tax=Catellatospora bangladeshensis TaxID=310355 RepID=UPI003620C7A6